MIPTFRISNKEGKSLTELLVAVSEGSQEIEPNLFNLSLLSLGLWKMEPLPFYVHFNVSIHQTYYVQCVAFVISIPFCLGGGQ